METITCYTDGSCLGNPGVGGFAATIKANEFQKIVKGYSKNARTTNNAMELKAVEHAVRVCAENFKKPCKIVVYTDSQYVCSCWKHDKYWLITGERPNHEIWFQIIKHLEKIGHKLEFVKIAGHSGIEMNERVDKLAYEQAVTARHVIFGGKNGGR